MTAEPTSGKRMTEAEYLAFERESEYKHEFIDGEIFMMSGASRNHSLITVSTSSALYNQLRGKGCSVYSSDMKVLTPSTDTYVYPDLTIVCGESQLADDKSDILLNPTLIIEILSPSTELHGRNVKFRRYREIETLQEYVLIAQDQARIERFLRQDDETWLFSEVNGLEASIIFPSISCTLRLAEIYEQVTFDPPQDAPQDGE